MSTPTRKKAQDLHCHDLIGIITDRQNKGKPSWFSSWVFFLLLLNFGQSSAQNEIAELYLKQLNQEKFDSIEEVKSVGKNGILKFKHSSYYTHYYKFNCQKFLTIVCLQIKEIYDNKGNITERIALHPFEGEISRYVFRVANLEKIYRYRIRGGLVCADPFSQSNLDKIREIIVLPNGERKIVWEQHEYKKYKAYKLNDVFSFGTDDFIEGTPYQKTVKYWVLKKKRNHFEITIFEPKNDSLLCRLTLPSKNEFIESDNPTKVKYWMPKVKILSSSVASVYDDKSQLRFIVDLSFNRKYSKPVKEFNLVKSTNGEDYFWVRNDSCALISGKGRLILPFAKQTLTSAKGDFLEILTPKGYTIYNLKGERLLPFVKESEALDLSESGIALIRESFYNPNKRRLFYYNLLTNDTLKVNGGYPFENQYGVTSIDEKKGIINSSGVWVVPPNKRINHIQLSGNGYAFIELDEPIWGPTMTRDLEHEYVLFNLESRKADTLNVSLRELRNNPKYSLSLYFKLYQDFFENGYALIEVVPDEGKPYGFSRFFTLMDLNGNLIDVKNRYKEIENEFNKYGQAIVGLEKMTQGKKGEYRSTFFGVIDKSGNEVIPCEYSGLELSKYGYIARNKDFKYGLIGFDGEIIIQLESTLNDVGFQLDKADNPFIYQLTLPIGGSEKK